MEPKISTEPIQAVRTFAMTDDGRLRGTASPYVFDGPVHHNPVPPYTADEWDWLQTHAHWKPDLQGDLRGGFYIKYKVVLDGNSAAQLVKKFGTIRAIDFVNSPTLHKGFHAFRSEKILRSRYKRHPYPVVGRVSLFGRVVEYEKGFRAEGMRIDKLKIDIPEERKVWFERWKGLDLVRKFEETYHCDVEVPKWLTSEKKLEFTKSNSPSGKRPGLTEKIRSAWRILTGKESL